MKECSASAAFSNAGLFWGDYSNVRKSRFCIDGFLTRKWATVEAPQITKRQGIENSWKRSLGWQLLKSVSYEKKTHGSRSVYKF
jgi:hypothetical protein